MQYHRPIDIHLDSMLEQLQYFCDINSGSRNLSGLAQMHEALKAAFTPLVDVSETHTLSPISNRTLTGEITEEAVGALLFLKKRPHLKRRILLSGHMDTVFDIHHPFQRIKTLQPGILNGPGVADMKGGLLVMLHALTAFEKTTSAQKIGWDIVINADEELGSPASRSFLEKIRPQYQAALVYEPSSTTAGGFARNRKGCGKFTLMAKGKAAHAGRDFHRGKNAIVYLSKILVEIDKLNQNTRNITINIGQIKGGEALNIVPDCAVAKLDVRIAHPDDAEWVQNAFQNICHLFQQKDYKLTLEGNLGRPVKQVNPATEALFKRLQTLAKFQGLTLDWQDTGGCCDGNNLAETGLAVLDTLGVRGGKIHSADEFIIVDSLVERATLSKHLFMDLANGGLEAL